MHNNFFRYKQFMVMQDRCAMKVGTDGNLLGAWADCSNAATILDIGTGTGLLALMLAQRTGAIIDAIEINESSSIQARENADNSKWGDRIFIKNISLQEYYPVAEKKYDLIVANPPYFVNSLKTPDKKRTMARHSDTLPHDELIKGVNLLLEDTGKFCTVFPTTEGNAFISEAQASGLYLVNKLNAYSNINKTEPKRLLLEFRKFSAPLIEENITIESGVRNQYTEGFKKLLKDFYLDFRLYAF